MSDRHPKTDPSHFSPVMRDLSVNPGAEIMRYAAVKPDIISLAQGDSDFGTPDFICDAVTKAMKQGLTHYGPPLGIPEQRQELSDYYKRIYGLDIGVERMFVTGSGSKAMNFCLKALVEKDDEVIAVTPIWKNLLSSLELAQCRITDVPMDQENGDWSLDLDKLMDACTAKTKLILITSPSNPSGWIMQRDQIKALMNFARERGIWIISDEVYSRTVYEGRYAPSFLEFATDDDLLFVVNSFSKTWAMTGWRLGWLVGPRAAHDYIRDIALYDYMGPPPFIQHGGIAALRDGEGFLKTQIDLWKRNRQTLQDGFAQSNRILSTPPESSFYYFFKVDGEPDDIALARRFVDEAGVSLAPGCAFGKVGTGYLRFCYAVSEEKVATALDRILSVIKD